MPHEQSDEVDISVKSALKFWAYVAAVAAALVPVAAFVLAWDHYVTEAARLSSPDATFIMLIVFESALVVACIAAHDAGLYR